MALVTSVDERELDRLRNKALRLESQIDDLQNELDNIKPYDENDKDTLSDIASTAREALFRMRNGFTVDVTAVFEEIMDTAQAQAKRAH